MAYNPYSAYNRTSDEDSYSREALIRAMEEPEPPPMTARPRTPTRTPQQTRERLSGPGGQTQYMDPNEAAVIGQNAFSGDRWQDDRQTPDPIGASAQPSASTAAPSPSNRQRGFDLMDKYDDPYTRRNEGAGGALSSAAKYGQLGATVGSVVPGVGTLVGGVVGGLGGLIGGAFAKNAKTAMTDFAIDDAKEIIAQAHQDAFGRDIPPEYLDQIIRGQGWQDGDRWMGQDQLAYVLDQFAQQAPGERASAEAAATAAAGTAPAGASPGGASAPGGLPFEGFDVNRAQNRAASAKDSYLAAVREAPPLTDTSKAGYEAWAREHIAPRMEADGHRIIGFEGDRINVESASGSGWVDGLRGAGGDRPGFAWQPDSVGGGAAGGGTITGSSGATSVQDAYAWLKQNADPSWTREEMQAAINAAFADVPGFVEGYAGDAVFEDGKLDLVTNFEGPGATWSDNLSRIPLHGASGAPSGGGTATGLNLAPGVSLAAPLGNSDVYAQVQAAIQRLMNGASTRDELLEALG